MITVRNKKQHTRYLKEVERLMKKDPDLNTKESNRLQSLAIAIEKYEDKRGWFTKKEKK